MTDQPKERVRVRAGSSAVAVQQSRTLSREQQPADFLSLLYQMAIDPRVDVGKMKAGLDMQERLEEREAKKAFTAAFMQLQHDIPAIRRDGKIEIREKDASGQRSGRVQQATPYATFNAIMKAVAKPLKKNGFALSFATEPGADGRIIVRGILDHEGGHQRTTSFPLPAETSGSKNNVQGWGSAMSYGKRYATIALLNIVSEAPEDMDTDGHEGHFKRGTEGSIVDVEPVRKLSRAQTAELEQVMQDCGVSVRGFCEIYGIKAVAELNDDLFEAAKKRCRDYKAKRDGNG